MRVVLAILMFATMIQVAQADDVDSSTTDVPRKCIDGSASC